MNCNYDKLVEKLAMGRIDVDDAAIPFVLEEARNRRDAPSSTPSWKPSRSVSRAR